MKRHVDRIELVDRRQQIVGPGTRAPSSSRARPTCPLISARMTQSSRSFFAASTAACDDSSSECALSTSCCATACLGSSGSRRATVRLALLSRATRAPIRGVVFHLIELVEHLALLHDAPFREGPLDDDALDARAHFHAAERLDLRAELVRFSDGRRRHRDHTNLRRRRRLLLRRRRRRLGAGGAERAKERQGEQ